MNSVTRLKLQIMRDDIEDHIRNFSKQVGDVIGRHKNRVTPSAGEIIQESEGRIWVQVGKKGHKIRVTHLHPANPAVAQALKKRLEASTNPEKEDPFGLQGEPIISPKSDDVSASSLEDYWFNHWQGPPICPNNNQNSVSGPIRSSIRKSRRKSHCGVCRKKVAAFDGDQLSTGAFVEADQDVLAHVPSVKPEIIVALEDFEDKDDEETVRVTSNEDSLSRTSVNDDHGVPAIANRVIDNELRTSLSLFAGEAICQDVVDTLISESKEPILLDNFTLLSQKPSPKRKLGQSLSCPCTPEPRRARNHKGSSKSPRNTSMSCSLLAIPKQANSLRSDFRFELRKSDSASCCHNSHRSSLISVQRRLSQCLETTNVNEDQNDIASSNEDLCDKSVKSHQEPYQPPLRLSKMSMTFRTCSISEGHEFDVTENSSEILPDLVSGVPKYGGGFLNLGFDGHGESSDYFEPLVSSEASRKPFCSVSLGQAHAVSVGHQSQGVQYGLSVEPDTGILFQDQLTSENHSNENMDEQGNEEHFDSHNEKPLPLSDYEMGGFWDKCRASIYWWRKPDQQVQGEEFCHNELECMTEQKPLIFFIHGIGSSSDIWTQQMWYFLSCGYEVVAPDMFGHGLSSAPDDPKHYTFSRMLDYIGLAFDLFVPHGRKCVVVGHNYGSALAVAFSRGRQFCVALTVLISCGGPNPLVPYAKDRSVLDSKLIRFVDPLITCGCLSRDLLYQPRGKHYQPSKGSVPSAPDYVIRHLAKGQVWPEGDIAFHRRITVPTLILYGMQDQNVTLVEMCEMEKTIPRAFLSYIPGAGHDLPTEASQQVCLSIHKFIRRWKHHLDS